MLTADSPSHNDNNFDGVQGQDTIDEPRALAKSLIESLNGPQDATFLTAIWDSSVQYQTKTQEILRDAHRSLSRMSFPLF